MRLIDVDKAENDIVENVTTKAVSRVVAILQGQPTVKAIPIEWIEKKVLEFLMNRNVRWATDFQEVIDLWKVENNIPLFDDEFKITWEKENQSLE